MNVSLSSNSATNKTSSLLDTGSASSKVEETGDSKGFFESFKEALGFEESGSKAVAKTQKAPRNPMLNRPLPKVKRQPKRTKVIQLNQRLLTK